MSARGPGRAGSTGDGPGVDGPGGDGPGGDGPGGDGITADGMTGDGITGDEEGASAWPGLVRPGADHWLWSAAPGSDGARAEAARLAWLGPRFPCPTPVAAEDTWLVTTAPAGAPATSPERQPRPDEVPGALGEALRRLHDLPAAECPFDRQAAVTAEIGAALADGRLDPARLPPPYDRYPPARLVELIGQGPPVGERVVCHGAPVIGRWFLDGNGLAAVVGVNRLGLADPHLDLAVIYRSLNHWFGPDAVFAFLEGYGRDPDLLRLDHHILIDVVLGAVIPPGPPPADLRPPAIDPGPPIIGADSRAGGGR